MNRDSSSHQTSAFCPPPSLGDHELLRRIGGGSYGEVWLARNIVGGYRAVKIVHRKTFDNDRPFEREFNGIKEYEPVSHSVEGLVHLLHVGRNEAEGYFYYVMELADDQQTGQQINPETYKPKTLRSEFNRRGRLPFKECLPLALSLAAALDRLHGQRLVHRDVKPSNIIFVNGVPKLADIGLVTSLDSTRSFVGTDGYVPPDGPGTPRADVYALGKVLYEASTGRDRQDYPELPTQLKDFSDKDALVRLNEVVVRACDPEPRNRYASAGEMQADLLRLQQGKKLAKKKSSHRPFAFAAVALAVLVAALSLLPRSQSLKLVRFVGPQALPPWTTMLADWNGDGLTEILTIQSNSFVVFPANEETKPGWKPRDTNAYGLSLDLVSEGDRQEPCKAFVDWRSGDDHTIVVLQPDLLGPEADPITFETKGVVTRLGQNWVSGTSLRALKFVDLERDGRRQLLACMNSGYGHSLRGLFSFSVEDRTLLWPRLTGPSISEIECLDLDGDKRLEIVCGSSASDNGNQGEDGTDDSQSYIFAFTSKGDLLWKTPLGPELSQAHPIAARLDRAGHKGLFAFLTSSGQDERRKEGLPDMGLIVRLNPIDGAVTNRYPVDNYLENCEAADLEGDGKVDLIATLWGGELRVLGADLKLKRTWRVKPNTATNLMVCLVAVGDLNQDGRPELAVVTGQYELASPVYLGLPGEPMTQRVLLGVRLHVLNGQLQTIAEYPLAERWTNSPGISGKVGNIERNGRNQLLLLADKSYIFELRPWPIFDWQ